ncbi:MAG: type I secretion system permease/ATPase [Alphaproteobacteria bacterium]|nr:type I secretion system permease/ATPase [Alphaproteobacteria bacterium]
MNAGKQQKGPLAEVVATSKRAFLPLILFSLGINLLMLTTAIYMLQVYDRVLGSRSMETLMALTLIALLALITMAALEALRSKLMIVISAWISNRLSGPLLAANVAMAASRPAERQARPLRDLEQLRNFLTGGAVFPLLDAPWAPIFLGAIFLLHPWLGWTALIGGLILFGLAILTELVTRGPLGRANQASTQANSQANSQAESALRNAEAIQAMGMLTSMTSRWREAQDTATAEQSIASVRAGSISAFAKFLRLTLQLSILGLGAYLAVQEIVTPGTMIAASILMGRALAPVEQAIGTWRTIVSARAAYTRVRAAAAAAPDAGVSLPLPRPKGEIVVDGVSMQIPGVQEPILKDISFKLAPGESLGLIGPSGAGKTSLARILVGAWAPTGGRVTLDGMDVARWAPEDRGAHVGYLPQDVELFAGAVKDNIARFHDLSNEEISQEVIRAAELAGVHELVKSLSNGYETDIGEGGAVLSGGQRQRVALARALFGDPAFLVLDEPNSSLDNDGEEALFRALATLKAAGRTLVMIAHRPRALDHVDKILVLRGGRVEMFGPRDAVMEKLTGQKPAASVPAQPMREVSASGPASGPATGTAEGGPA